MGNTTTAGAVEMARRIACEQWPSSHDFPERDAAEAAALAAIIETTEAAARLVTGIQPTFRSLATYTDDIRAEIAEALRNNDHLERRP